MAFSRKNTQRIVIRDLKVVIQKIVIFTQLQNKFGTSNLSNKLPVDDVSYEVYFKERYYMLCTSREIEIE